MPKMPKMRPSFKFKFKVSPFFSGSKNAAEASNVAMGNTSVINASCHKTPSDCDDAEEDGNNHHLDNILHNNPDNNLSDNMVASTTTAIQNENETPEVQKRKEKGKTLKSSIKSNFSKSSSKKKGTKELQQELSDLQNQLNERSERINELETSLKNKNNGVLLEGEREEFARRNLELENELTKKNLSITEVEHSFSSAQFQVAKCNKALEALAIVIQRYLEQLHEATCKNGVLSTQRQQVGAQLEVLMNKLVEERTRCEAVQRDCKQLVIRHEAEISTLNGRHHQEEQKLRQSLEEQTQARLGAAKEEYLRGTEHLKGEHQNEIVALSTQHHHQLQEVLQGKGNTFSDMLLRHDSVIKMKEAEHTRTMEDLKNIHERQIDQLNERLTLTIDEKDKLQNRLEGIVKYIESDNSVQAALLPYKDLPEELQSLRVVLELRNEEIRNSRLKTMELEKKVDEYYELQTKFDALSQENVSLKENLKKRTVAERKLSLERDTLIEKFENEIKKVNLLAMEKEQQMWKTCNPTGLKKLSTSLPNGFEDVEEEVGSSHAMSPQRSSGSFSTSPLVKFTPAKPKPKSSSFSTSALVKFTPAKSNPVSTSNSLSTSPLIKFTPAKPKQRNMDVPSSKNDKLQ